MYNSEPVPQIYQEEPLYSKKTSFKPKGWTETEVGYLNEADKLSRCLLLNRKYMKQDYTWAVSLNVEAELWPQDIKAIWTKACRKLKARSVTALWVREPSPSNHCNYHLAVKNDISKAELEEAIEEAMPDRTDIPWHKHIRRVQRQYHFARYITKAKTKGIVNGKPVSDKYRAKRLLFQTNLDLKKHGTIGKFWEKPKKQLWQDIRDTEQRITDGLEQPKFRLLARHVYEMIGGYFPLKHVERSIGFHASEPSTQAWAERVWASKGPEAVAPSCAGGQAI